MSVASDPGRYRDVFKKFSYLTLHCVRSGFRSWLFFTRYRASLSRLPDRKDVKGVIECLDNYCNPRRNIPFETIFSIHGSKSLANRLIADKCAFDAITPDDLLRDIIVFGIQKLSCVNPNLTFQRLRISVGLQRCLIGKVIWRTAVSWKSTSLSLSFLWQGKLCFKCGKENHFGRKCPVCDIAWGQSHRSPSCKYA